MARVWQATGLKFDLVKTFKVSRDKKFIEKLVDVVGLYLRPSTRWCYVPTKKPRFKPWTAPKRDCHFNQM
jgi:hypothetical protein